MGVFSNIFMKHDKETIQLMMDFVEGRISVKEFKEAFDTNPKVKKTLRKDPHRTKVFPYGWDLEGYMAKQNIDKIADRYEIWGLIINFLKRNKYSVIYPELKYEKEYDMKLDIVPGYVYDITDEIFYKVTSEVPSDLTKTKKIKWCKDKIKTLYRYERTYPRWVQSPECPISKEGKPLLFLYQKSIKNSEQVFYYFKDESTDEIVEVEQLY